MSLLTCNGLPVLSATLELPVTGIWRGELEVESKAAVTGAVTLSTAGMTLVGTVTRSGRYADRATLQVEGGAARLARTQLPPRGYARNIPARLVLDGIARESGETLSPTISAAVLSTILPTWARTAGTAETALRELADGLGLNWRTLDDGTLWIGTDAWAASSPSGVSVVSDDPARGLRVIASDRPELRPGVTYDGRRVRLAVHKFAAGGVRTEAWFTGSVPTEDPVRAAIRRVVADEIAAVRYHALWPATVIAQSASTLALDVRPDATGIVPPMVDVPLLAHAPGVAVKVSAGARVLIGWREGDPRKPYAMAFENDRARLTEIAFDGGTKGVARIDDTVDGGTLYLTVNPSTGAVTAVVHVPPGGTPVPGAVAVPLSGKITTGAAKVKA